MEKDIFSTIIKEIDEEIIDKKEISVKNEDFKKIEEKDVNKKLAFIDGGQAELFKGVSFSLQFIRVVGIVFNEKKINEFFVLIKSEEKEGSIFYKTKVFIVKGKGIEELNFDSLDKTIMDGNERAEVSKIGGILRRFAEIEMARGLLDEVDIVVLDGSLKAMVTDEETFLKKLYEDAKEKNVIVCGLVKGGRIFTKGNCLLSSLNKDLGYEWYYKIKDEKDYNVYAVKLNKKSKYVFEFDIFNDEIGDVLSLLVGNSNDAVFLGYPYGLILADKVARVSNEEKNYLITRFNAKIGKKWDKAINVLNSHDVLDSVG